MLIINLSALFEEGQENQTSSQLQEPVLIKREKRCKLVYPDDKSTDYLLTGLDGQFEVMYSEIEPGGSSGECITVLEGDLEISIGDNKHILNEGDTITFSSHIPHGWTNIGKKTLKLIWIVTPPTY